jgi:hypothetical protein
MVLFRSSRAMEGRAAGMGFDEAFIDVQQVGDNLWELQKPVVYHGNADTFTVDPPFRTDFASVPGPFVWLIPRYGKYTKAAILHDYLCAEAREGRFKRSDADGIFRRAMRELQVSFLRRWIMWAAVRFGGGSEVFKPGLAQFLLVLLVALPAFAFVAGPSVVVVAALAVFLGIEWVVFALLKPFSKKPVNRPRLTLPSRAPLVMKEEPAVKKIHAG